MRKIDQNVKMGGVSNEEGKGIHKKGEVTHPLPTIVHLKRKSY